MSRHRWHSLRQLGMELLEDFKRSRDFSPIHEILGAADEDERSVILHNFFWEGLRIADWDLAEGCLQKGYCIGRDPKEITEGPLCIAMQEFPNRVDVIEWMIRHGADIEHRDLEFATPLICASARGMDEIVQLLLDNGADVNATEIIDDDRSSLMLAAICGHESTVRLLLAHGADRLRRKWGQDAADMAEKQGHHDLARKIRNRKV